MRFHLYVPGGRRGFIKKAFSKFNESYEPSASDFPGDVELSRGLQAFGGADESAKKVQEMLLSVVGAFEAAAPKPVQKPVIIEMATKLKEVGYADVFPRSRWPQTSAVCSDLSAVACFSCWLLSRAGQGVGDEGGQVEEAWS